MYIWYKAAFIQALYSAVQFLHVVAGRRRAGSSRGRRSGRVPASRARLRSSTLGSEVRGGGPDFAGGWGVKYVGIFGGVKDFRVVENVKVEEEGGARRLGKVGAAGDL